MPDVHPQRIYELRHDVMISWARREDNLDVSTPSSRPGTRSTGRETFAIKEKSSLRRPTYRVRHDGPALVNGGPIPIVPRPPFAKIDCAAAMMSGAGLLWEHEGCQAQAVCKQKQ